MKSLPHKLIWTKHRAAGNATPAPMLSPIAFAVACAFAGAQVFGSIAHALPTGGTVVGGQASVAQSGTSMVVTQTTNRAALNWQSFGIAAGESVKFVQPSTSSVALNRVVGSDTSAIYGSLTANGQVFLLNPNGIVFGAGARVDVGGLVASTLSMNTADFMADSTTFSNGNGTGSITNSGILNGGYVALIAPQVNNQGSIHTPNGTTSLVAGDRVTLDLRGDALIGLSVDAAALNANITHGGSIQAAGGAVYLSAKSANTVLPTVINSNGIITASSLSERGGKIYLDGGEQGVVRLSGQVEAKSGSQSGGSVTVLGQHVKLEGNTAVDASGQTGGGTVLIGGNWQGQGPQRNATSTYVGPDVTIKADAMNVGNGGTVVVWADGATDYSGHASARGGALAGDGGRIEVSGKKTLTLNGSVDAGAANGAGGQALFDPEDVEIVAGAAGAGQQSAATIVGTLNGNTNVTVITANAASKASGSITVNAPITWASAANLTLRASDATGNSPGGGAGGSVTINQAITNSGTGSFTAQAGSGLAGVNDGLGTGVGGSAGGAGGSVTVAANVSAPGGITLIAGNGGVGGNATEGGTGGTGGAGGTVTINGTLSANGGAGAISLTAGAGGAGGTSTGAPADTRGAGGAGGSVTVNNAMSTNTGGMTIVAGAGGNDGAAGTNRNAGGDGGNITVNTAGANSLSTSGNVVLTAGAAGVGGVNGTAGNIRGTNVGFQTAGSITLNSALDGTTGNLNLLAGTNAGSALTYQGANLDVTGDVVLRAHNLAVSGRVGGTDNTGALKNVTLDAGTGTLTLGAASDVKGDTVVLRAGTTVSQTAGANLRSDKLLVSAGGNVALTAGTNRQWGTNATSIQLAASLSAGSFDYKSSLGANEKFAPNLGIDARTVTDYAGTNTVTGITAPGGISVQAANGSTMGFAFPAPSRRGGSISVGKALTTNGNLSLIAGNATTETNQGEGDSARKGGEGGDISFGVPVSVGGNITLTAGNGGKGGPGGQNFMTMVSFTGGTGGRGGKVLLGQNTLNHPAAINTAVTSTGGGTIIMNVGTGGAGGDTGFNGAGPGAAGAAGFVTGVNGSGVSSDIVVTTSGSVAINGEIKGDTQGLTNISQANVTIQAGKTAGKTVTFQNITSNKAVLIEGYTINNTSVVRGDLGVTLDAGTGGSVTNAGTLTNGGAAATSIIALNGGTVNLTGGTITTGAGRYMTYTPTAAGLTRGGFTGANLYGKTFAANAPSTITQTGNRFIFANVPALTATASSGTMVYGGTVPTFTLSVDPAGLINGDTLAQAVTGAGTASVSGALNAGNKAVNANLGTLFSDIGYTFTLVNGTLTITPRAATVTATAGLSKLVGTGDPTLTFTVTGLLGGDTLTGVLGRASGETAGSYAINQGSLANSNYALTFNGASFTIIASGSAPAPAPTPSPQVTFFNPDANGPGSGDSNQQQSPTINNPTGPLDETGVVVVEGGQRLPQGVQ